MQGMIGIKRKKRTVKWRIRTCVRTASKLGCLSEHSAHRSEDTECLGVGVIKSDQKSVEHLHDYTILVFIFVF